MSGATCCNSMVFCLRVNVVSVVNIYCVCNCKYVHIVLYSLSMSIFAVSPEVGDKK